MLLIKPIEVYTTKSEVHSMQIKKKWIGILKRSQDGMQTMPNEPNCIINVWHNLLKGEREEKSHHRPEKPKEKLQQNAMWHPGLAPRTAKGINRKTGEIQIESRI